MQERQERSSYRYVVVSFLAVVYTFNFMDRQIMSILQEPIRLEMGLSDTQLGMLTGLTFALFYTTCGLPVAWLSDRYRRVSLMAAACGIWSLFTAGCGLASNFTQLALSRVMVGAGEAGGSPPSYSLISDYFPPEERGTGLAIYSLGVPVGSALGVAAGGWVAAQYGWRTAFVAVGLPGIALALLMLLIIREPKRGGLDPVRAGAIKHDAPQGIRAGLATFFQNRTMVLTALSSGLSAFVGYAMLSWNPPFLERVKGMSLTQVAAWYSLVLGICLSHSSRRGKLSTALGGLPENAASQWRLPSWILAGSSCFLKKWMTHKMALSSSRRKKRAQQRCSNDQPRRFQMP